jgi:hypothetical protein
MTWKCQHYGIFKKKENKIFQIHSMKKSENGKALQKCILDIYHEYKQFACIFKAYENLKFILF